MRLVRISLLTLAVAVLAVGNVWAEDAGPTYPDAFDHFGSGGEFAGAERSGMPNPLVVTTGDAAYSGSGSATIRFNTTQRGDAVVVIYRTDSNETGARGPNGAWLRLQPQSLYVNHISKAVEAGNNSVTWDGKDFEGNAAGSGSFEFDVFVMNTKDAATLVGPGARGAAPWNEINIDIKQDPPEVWAPGNADGVGNSAGGDNYRGTIGTDYISNPSAELWNATYFNFEGATSFSGIRPDDQDKDVYWNLQWVGDLGGIYKSKINRASKSWELDESFGDGGFMKNIHDRACGMWPEGDFIIKGHWSVIDNPATSVEYHDKTSGEIVKATPMNDFFGIESTDDDGNVTLSGQGPGKVHANSHGVVTNSWRINVPTVMLDPNGDPLWAHYGGDGMGMAISNEVAAETGLPAYKGNPIHEKVLAGGRGVLMTEVHSTTGSMFVLLGRDGTGIKHFYGGPKLPFAQLWSNRTIPAWELMIVDEDTPGHAATGGKYDGIYYGSHIGLEDGLYENTAAAGEDSPAGACCGEGKGPGTLWHIGFDHATGRMGAGVTAVEEVAAAGIPSSYSLSDAYPNPFNPETTIEFNVPVDDYVKIDVFNTAGQLVASMVDDDLSAGSYKATWDATDKAGSQVSSGVYFYRMQAGDFTDTRSMTLLK